MLDEEGDDGEEDVVATGGRVWVCEEEIGCVEEPELDWDGFGSRIGNVGSRYNNGEVDAPCPDLIRGRDDEPVESEVEVGLGDEVDGGW